MIEIIPAIDLIDGKCVRLTQGNYSSKTSYFDDPLDVAKRFEDAAIHRLHLVDLDGAKSGKVVNYKVLERIASQTSLRIDFGGGLRSDEDLKIAFESGAKLVTAGSIAVKNEEMVLKWLEKFGNEAIILGADVKNNKIAINAWQEESKIYIFDFLNTFVDKGFKYSICTDVSKDGMLEGPSIELYKEILGEVENVKLIASGGISSLSDIDSLQEMGIFGVIIGKAIYEGKISLKDLTKYILGTQKIGVNNVPH